jgi:hypothetical protein
MVPHGGGTASGPDKLTGISPAPIHKKPWRNGAPPPIFATHPNANTICKWTCPRLLAALPLLSARLNGTKSLPLNSRLVFVVSCRPLKPVKQPRLSTDSSSSLLVRSLSSSFPLVFCALHLLPTYQVHPWQKSVKKS